MDTGSRGSSPDAIPVPAHLHGRRGGRRNAGMEEEGEGEGIGYDMDSVRSRDSEVGSEMDAFIDDGVLDEDDPGGSRGSSCSLAGGMGGSSPGLAASRAGSHASSPGPAASSRAGSHASLPSPAASSRAGSHAPSPRPAASRAGSHASSPGPAASRAGTDALAGAGDDDVSQPGRALPAINPNCSNNISKSLRIVDMQEFMELTDRDGVPLVFLSEAEGPSIPPMAMTQVLCLLHLLDHPLTPEHIIGNSIFEPVWVKSGGGGRGSMVMQKLLSKVFLDQERSQARHENRVRFENGRIDEFPSNFYCNFTQDTTSNVVERVAPFAQILMAPCVTSYASRSGAGRSRKTFWMVILLTKRVYHVVQHLKDFLTSGNGRDALKRDFVQQKAHEEILQLWKETLLHQYSMSASASEYHCAETSRHLNPVDRLDQPGEPDSLAGCCNLFEAYRSIVKGCGPGAYDVHVEGFSDTLQYTNSERMNWGESIRSQASWVESFAQARKHTQERKDDIMRASKITDLSAREEALSLLEEQDLGVRVDLEPPCGWPVCREDDCIVGGIPPMSICMLVDVQGSFGGETSLSSFRTSFGDLPPRATMELTQLMYKEDDGAQAGDEYSTDRFLPPSKFMTEYDRLTEYSHVLNSMKGFYVAGHYTEQLLRNLRYFQDSISDCGVRVKFYSRYLRDSLRFHRSIVMNGNLRNKHAEFQMKYIAVAERSIIPDLHALRQRQFQYEPGGPKHHAGAPELVDWQGRACWEAQNPDSFLFYLWEYQELYRRFNCEFVSLTPSNLFTCQCVVMSTIMYRIGHGNPNYTRMGMCNSVMNAAGKLPCTVEGSKKRMSDVRKLTGAGLDYVNNAVNLFRSMYGAYLNVHTEGNKQRVRNIRRTTEGSLYDYVTFMDGKIINAPTNVGEDTAMTEGPSARKENLEGLFNQIDRDDDPHNSIMNTVDLNQNNNRKQTTAEPLAGWKLFLVLIGVNNTFEAVLQTRYQQMLIACNPVCASAPNDDFWTMRVHAGGDVDEGADYDRMDEMQLHKGGINQAQMPSGKMKGNTPDVPQQKEWAPFMYFVPGIAGTCIGISNKLGSWTLPINYAVKAVCDNVYTVVSQHLGCLTDEDDQRNSSRYFEGLKCRMVAQTVLIKTYQCMCNSPTFEEAQLSAVQALNVNGLHLSLVAPLCHQLVQRLVKFAPLLVLSTVLPYMRVPVVSLRSVLELFNGLAISDPREALAVKSFLQRALDTGSFLPLTPTPNGRSDPSSNITPYLSSILPVDQGPSGSNISEMRQTLPQADKSSLSFEVVRLIASTLYKRNAKTLKQCAFVQEESTFAFMLNSVRDQEYDLRGLFGGMSSFANSRALVRAGTGRSADGMPTTFKTSSDSSTQSPDPMFIIERVSNNHHEYALGVRVWDALLFASLMRRPRRDYGIVYDFAQSVTEYVLRSLPCSVMPYSVIPSMRYDPFSGEQTHLRVEGGHRRPWLDVADDRPEQVLRFRDSRTVGPNAAFTYASPGPTGIVEDDAFMAPIIALQQTLKCEHFSDIPLDLWHLDIGWQWGAVYPFVVYPNTRARDPPLPWQRGLGTPGRRFAVVLNQRRFSMQLYAQCGDQAADVADFYGESVGFVDDWVQASMELVAEFTVVRPTGGDPPPHTSVLGTFHACQQALFASGVGPVPYLRRPGIAVRTPSGIGCVVPHRHARSGCRAAPTSRCYFCVNNPYVEASVSPGEPVHRCCAEALLRGDTLVRAGTALLLSLECPDFVAAFLPHQVGPRPAHKRAHCAGGQPQAADPEDPEDEHGFLLPDQGAEREDARVDPGEPTASQNGDRILCWLQVPSSITPRDGYLSVAVRCKVGIDPSQTHVLSVQPAFLSLPSGSEEAADARQMVYGLPRRQAHP